VEVSNGWHDVLQGSPEWDKLREGRLTSSEIYRIITDKKTWNESSLLTRGGETYVKETLRLKRKEKKQTQAMQNGSERENGARLRFELVHDIKVQKTGFYTYGDLLGFSSDGLTTERNGRKGVLEIKCPEELNHLNYCLCRSWADIKKASPLLCWEMCLPLLLLPELEAAWFVSYYPEYLATDRKHLALFALCLERNEELLTKLACSLLRAKIYRDGLVKKLGL